MIEPLPEPFPPAAQLAEKRKKTPKRYETEGQILADIEKCEREISALRTEAEIMGKIADLLRDYPNWTGGKHVDQLRFYREQAERHRGWNVTRWERKKSRLGEALATIRTGVLPMIVDDESVVVR